MADLRHWIITTSPTNIDHTAAHGWTVQGFKSRQRKNVMERMAPGDRLAWYVTGAKAFAAVATVASAGFEDHTRIWETDKANEDYAWRVHIRPDVALPDSEWLPAEPIALQLDHVHKWPPANWTLAFQGNLREVSAADFAIIERAVREAAPTPQHQ